MGLLTVGNSRWFPERANDIRYHLRSATGHWSETYGRVQSPHRWPVPGPLLPQRPRTTFTVYILRAMIEGEQRPEAVILRGEIGYMYRQRLP